MPSRKITAAILLVICLVLVGPERGFGDVPQQHEFPELLQQLAALPPDPCMPGNGKIEPANTGDTISLLFDRAADTAMQQLNAAGAAQPQDRAAGALKRLEQLSAETNAAWPDENRFHFQILELSSTALVIKISLRTDARFYVIGMAEEDGKGNPNHLWQNMGEEPEQLDLPGILISLFSLHRSSAGNARFLASITRSGCAGSTGISYDAREWNPARYGSLEQIIKQDGSFGMGDNVPGFPQLGKLRTQGKLISLPYCWFSALDRWDNPSLCAVDTYDLSDNNVRFVSRIYNRPDLVPIAKAIQYAQQHDYRAVLSYCASAQVARHLVRDISPVVFPEDLQVKSTGPGRERVKFSEGGYRFSLEKRAGVRIIVDFRGE